MSTASPQPEPTRVRPVSQIPDARRQIVENARQSWILKLIDLSRRNNLLYFRPLKKGTLDLTSAPSERLRYLLMGQVVAVAKLAPDLEAEVLTKILRDIFRRALENSEEKGLSTLFVTFGMATWPAFDGGGPAESPVLLLHDATECPESNTGSERSRAPYNSTNLTATLLIQFCFHLG